MYNKNQLSTINNFLFSNFPITWENTLEKYLKDLTDDGILEREDDEAVERAIEIYIQSLNTLDFISLETGEIVYHTTTQDILEGRAPKPSLPFSEYGYDLYAETDIHAVMDMTGFDHDAADDYVLKTCPFGSWKGHNGTTRKNYQTGIIEHRPSWEGPWHNTRMILSMQMTNQEGVITDKFYGAQNDFGETFLAKCLRGEKFRLFAMDDEMKMVCVSSVESLFFADAKWSFSMGKDMKWKLDEYKKI